MASTSASTKVEKLSFAKVAAAGLKPSSAPESSSRADNPLKNDRTLSPSDGTKIVSPSNKSSSTPFTPKQNKIVTITPSCPEDIEVGNTTDRPSVQVESVGSIPTPDKAPRALDGMLMPTATDEAGTQASSSDSVKPPSLDGKSVTSGTTFALDEKESLRPDDSASVKARDEEDVFTPPDSTLPEAQIESEDEMRVFRDQLREISGIDPGRQPIHTESFCHNGVAAQGVLYVPPLGLGVGNVPGSTRESSGVEQIVDFPPDPKLLEALESPKDRIMVLKLEQDIVDFIKDAKESSLKLPQTNTFYRMLAHKLADYYMLGHVVDESTMAVRIYKTPNCRLPPPLTGIATPSTAASTPPPAGAQMKILRRGVDGKGPTIADGSNVTSKTTSENGESGNEDEKKGKLFTREEREARYEAARKRIMGSAKPLGSPEASVEKDNSRPSSAAGRRTLRKKQRADSDDDFEARSAYSAYYAVPQPTPGEALPTPYGYAGHPQASQFSPAAYGHQSMAANYFQYGGQQSPPWVNPTLYPQQGSGNWTQHHQGGYDLSADFQRNMAFQPPPAPNPNAQARYNVHYDQQFSTPHQAWHHQNSHSGNYPPQVPPGYGPGYPSRTPPAPNQVQDAHPYPYGELPSHSFPGRPPSKLEHPLPGSYKSKHFNPQSQSFVPGQTNNMNSVPMQYNGPSPGQSAYNGGYGMPGTPQHQNSASFQNAAFGSPQLVAVAGKPSQGPTPQMTHPLPQPVFPRQPSPNVPLPPKPDATPPRPVESYSTGPAIVSSVPTSQSQNSIAKWGTASLPAKPPPAVEGFDSTKFAQSQRHPSGSGRPTAMPIFGSMPPATGSLALHAPNGNPTRRG